MRFNENSPDAVPLHTMRKEWAHVFVDSNGGVNVERVYREHTGFIGWGDSMRLTPEKAELLIKALKRNIKEAKRSGRRSQG